jgi:hypothetical protein
MFNLLQYLRKYHPNIFSLTVSFLLALWFNGIAGLINHLLPNRDVLVSVILMTVPVIILLFDDGNLDEIYNSKTGSIGAITTAAANMPNQNISEQIEEKFDYKLL